MARRGRQEFSVQEAVNMDAFGDWNYQEVDLSSAGAKSVTAITASNPAKKIVMYNEPGGTTATIETDDVLTLTINGQSDSEKLVKIDSSDLPFTLTGLLVTSLTITNSDPEGTEGISVLSFH